jgi:pantoate--beta-alanine ligase
LELITERETFRHVLERARSSGHQAGLVPTMGALHEGHLSLVRAARERGGVVAMSVFVNPLQFGDPDDLSAYPRDLDVDLVLAERAGVDVVFAPTVAEMYPDGPPETTVVPGTLADRLEGAARPGHFAGVATVVTKLFGLAGAAAAYFGEKDFQQLAIIRRLVADLELPVEVVGCPIVREPDGLALSSRNRRLSPPEREAALVLPRALDAGQAAIGAGESSRSVVESAMSEVLAESPLVEPGYCVVADPVTLEAVEVISRPVRLLVAATVGKVRLIDNAGA